MHGDIGNELDRKAGNTRPPNRRKGNSAIEKIRRISKGPRAEDQIRIRDHIRETEARHEYLIRLCRALMQYGAPTHRLEEYMVYSARVLQIDSNFLYIPGCMIISFEDSEIHASEVKLVKQSQGVDLGKLKDTHEVYKKVVHDRIGVDEATECLAEIEARPDKFNVWLRVLIYGLASTTVGPFAFQARLIDLPCCFMLGCLLGVMQLVISPRSELYSNVFEIAASIVTSFLARALGSINGGNLFCFSAMAQSSIALILPGYTVCKCLRLPWNLRRGVPANSVLTLVLQCVLRSSCSRAILLRAPSAWCMQ